MCIVLSGCLYVAVVAQPRVMALVREHLVEDLQPELDRWIDDLANEGYTGFVKTWPDSLCEDSHDNPHLQQIWEFIRNEYQQPEKLQGVILIGRYPWLFYEKRLVYSGDGKEEKYLCFQAWHTLKSMSSFVRSPNNIDIWVSRIDALDKNGRELFWGSEVSLIKRYFQTNHEHRTGVHRLPHTSYAAVHFLMFHKDNDGKYNYVKYGEELERLYPKYLFVGSAERRAFDGGGEYCFEYAHGGSNGNDIYDETAILKTPAQVRHNAMSSCGETVGGIATKQIFGKHGGITTACYFGLFHSRELMNGLIAGKTFGESYLLGPDLSSSTFLYGDWTLKPMMYPANEMPKIKNITITNTAVVGQPTTFSVEASDDDGTLETIEFYPEGFGWGNKEPETYNYSDTFQYAFNKTGKHYARVMISDNYKAWAWADIVIDVGDGNVFTSNHIAQHTPTRTVTIIAGTSIKKIPVPAFPVTIQTFKLNGTHLTTYRIENARQKLILPKYSGMHILKLRTTNSTATTIFTQF